MDIHTKNSRDMDAIFHLHGRPGNVSFPLRTFPIEIENNTAIAEL